MVVFRKICDYFCLSQVVSGSDDHTVMLWDTSNGARLHTVTFCSAVMSLAWHPDEVSKLLIGVKNGVIHIFNIASYHVSLIQGQ
jgi:WD40 repeat protein